MITNWIGAVRKILVILAIEFRDVEDLPDSAYPICYHDIAKAQETDAKLQQKLVSHKDYTLDTFRGGDKDHRLICRNNKTCLPTALQKKTIEWYHEMLCHPGETRTEHTLCQHFDWRALRTTVHDVCRSVQLAREKKGKIRNMANCHLNRLKQIPGTLYV